MKKFIEAIVSVVMSMFLGCAMAEAAQPGLSIDQLTKLWVAVDHSGMPLNIEDTTYLNIYRDNSSQNWFLRILGPCSEFFSKVSLKETGELHIIGGHGENHQKRYDELARSGMDMFVGTGPSGVAAQRYVCRLKGIGDQLTDVARNTEFRYSAMPNQIMARMPNGKRLAFIRYTNPYLIP